MIIQKNLINNYKARILKTTYYNNQKIAAIIILIIIAISLFSFIAIKLRNHYVYYNNPYTYDRFYSYDDLYYADKVFNSTTNKKYELKYSAVKHPLFLFGANKFTQFEQIIKPEITFMGHYMLLVTIQILVSLLGIIFFFLILYDIFKLNLVSSFLLTLVFMISNSVIISTVLLESFIYSSSLLIINYYFLSKKKYILSGILGVLIFGTTITNVCIWGLSCLALINFKDIKSWLKLILSFIISFILTLGLVFAIESSYVLFIFDNFFNVISENSKAFSIDLDGIKRVKMLFYYLLSSGLFYIDTANTNQLGTGVGVSISFILNASALITWLTGIIYIYILSIIKKIDRNILACMLILIFNVILHFGYNFGLHEAFLYTPHFLFSVIFLLALGLKKAEKRSAISYSIIILIFICELMFNFQSINDIIEVVGG